MQREISQAIGGTHPYDPMVSKFEPGMTYAQLQTLYTQLKTALVPLIQRAAAAKPPRMDFLNRSFPKSAQSVTTRSIMKIDCICLCSSMIWMNDAIRQF